ncbi:MAG: hypothetical protein OXJ36_06570 [bacterium]|nr:hypothetical protein [bacterium]MDE0438046.1 hypothetical protein [bacterium]
MSDPDRDLDPESEPDPDSESKEESEPDPDSESEEESEPEDELDPESGATPDPTEAGAVADEAVAESTGDDPPPLATQTTSRPTTPTVDSPVPIFVIPLLLLLLLLLLAIEVWRRTRRWRKEKARLPDDVG